MSNRPHAAAEVAAYLMAAAHAKLNLLRANPATPPGGPEQVAANRDARPQVVASIASEFLRRIKHVRGAFGPGAYATEFRPTESTRAMARARIKDLNALLSSYSAVVQVNEDTGVLTFTVAGIKVAEY